ncbi:hypothetical protein F5B19DRAFT_202779 [Rostrohypoxylon terebratum]|nr:hypothetical protein F5B19DRAFT_202779 [Rostrohypoxylon terebratum]
MAVTELAWLTATSKPLTSEGKEATNQALDVQDGWIDRNVLGLPKERENRGVGLFQQIEDPSINLLTAHWESAAQHKVWIDSPENKTVFPGLKDYFQLEKTYLFHYGVELFAPGPNGETSLLKSPFFSVSRIAVAAEERGAFDKAWNEVKGVLEEFAKPYAAQAGWRVEKEDDNLEEFVLGVGWPNVERHAEFATAKDSDKLSAALTPFIKNRDLAHYKRIL